MPELVITNGDMAAMRLRGAGIGGDMLPWRDVLYEGPVPCTLDLSALSSVRARYLVDKGWGRNRDIAAEFRNRDDTIERHARYDVVTLWFEHDLADTLQLLQMLDYFASAARPQETLRIVHTDKHITSLDDDAIISLAAASKPVGTARLNQARDAWDRWRRPDPRRWAALFIRPRLNLKHLWYTVGKSLSLLPDVDTGTSWPEHYVLTRLDEQSLTPGELFTTFSGDCDRLHGRWMGDWSLFAVLDRLAAPPTPLIEGLDGGPFQPGFAPDRHNAYLASRLRPTPLGRHVLRGEAHWALMTDFDFWVGGTHVCGDRIWSYDTRRHLVVKRSLR